MAARDERALQAERNMRALIVDDEVHAREELAVMIEQTGEFEILGSCSNALEALQSIRNSRPDVVFLDIQMPVISGIELLSMIDEEDLPHVVFVTAYDEYAIRAFEENALDYLLKPVEEERLSKTIHRLRKILGQQKWPGANNGSGAMTKPPFPFTEIKKLPCLLSNRVKLIDAREVEFVRSDMAGVYVICPRGEFYTELTLKVLEARTNMVRCHRQFLVNLDSVDEIILHGNMLAQIQTKSGRSVPVSRRYLKAIKERLEI